MCIRDSAQCPPGQSGGSAGLPHAAAGHGRTLSGSCRWYWPVSYTHLKPTEGKVLIEGTELSAMNRTQAAIFRRRKVGLVYQFYNLIPTLTVRKNILMPLLLDKRKPNKEYFEQIVHSLGIEDKLESLPSQLSGGQQQRVAIARSCLLYTSRCV